MKILGLIPARGGSKGISKKNIKPLGGKPLLEYTFEAAKTSKLLNRIILSSDSKEIINIARQIGLEAPFLRPSNLALDESSSLDVIRHAINFFEVKGEYFDAICLLQPTTPFRKKGLIDEAIKKLQKKDFDSVITVRKVPAEFNPHWVFEEKNGSLKLATGDSKIITRRQDLPTAFHRDGALYLTRTNTIIQDKSLYGNHIGYIDTTEFPYVNIDLPEDWTKAEKILDNL